MPCCSAVNCSNRNDNGPKKSRLFRFPADAKRKEKWVQNCRRDFTPTSSSRLCEKHFEESQFEFNRADGWRKLKPNAIPTLFDVPNPPPRIDPLPRKSFYKVHFEPSQFKAQRKDGLRKLKPTSTPTLFNVPNPPPRIDPPPRQSIYKDIHTISTCVTLRNEPMDEYGEKDQTDQTPDPELNGEATLPSKMEVVKGAFDLEHNYSLNKINMESEKQKSPKLPRDHGLNEVKIFTYSVDSKMSSSESRGDLINKVILEPFDGQEYTEIEILDENELETDLENIDETCDDSNEAFDNYFEEILPKSAKSKLELFRDDIIESTNEIPMNEIDQETSSCKKPKISKRNDRLNMFLDNVKKSENLKIRESECLRITGIVKTSMKQLLKMQEDVRKDLATIEDKIIKLHDFTSHSVKDFEPKSVVCCTCLLKDSNIKMYDMLKYQVLEQTYRRLIGAQIAPFMPHYFCMYCASMLIKYHKFREKCLRAQEHFRQIPGRERDYSSSLRKLNLGIGLKRLKVSDKFGAYSCVGGDPEETTAAGYIHEFQTSLPAEQEIQSLIKSEICDEEGTEETDTISKETMLTPFSKKEVKNTYACFKEHSKKKMPKKPKTLKIKKDRGKVLDSAKWSIHHNSVKDVLQDIESAKKYFTRAPHKCSICYFAYSTPKKLNDHYASSHNADFQFACQYCKKRFKKKLYLKSHLELHMRVYKCKLCKFKTKDKSKVLPHERLHEGVTFACEECGSQHSNLVMLKAHIRCRHYHDTPCPRCGRAFASPYSLKQHNRTNCEPPPTVTRQVDWSDSPMECEACNVTFESSAAFANHFKTTKRHQPEGKVSGDYVKMIAKKVPECLKCNLKFETKTAWAEHKAVLHKGEPPQQEARAPLPAKKIACKVCGAMLCYGAMRSHLLLHADIKPYRCDECGRDFRNQANMNRHKSVHTGLRPYVCDICGKSFTQTNSLKLHISTVHLKQPHPKRKPRKKQVDLEEQVFGSEEIQTAGSEEIWIEIDAKTHNKTKKRRLQDEGNQAVVVQKMEGNWQERDPWGEIANERPKKGFKRPRYAD